MNIPGRRRGSRYWAAYSKKPLEPNRAHQIYLFSKDLQQPLYFNLQDQVRRRPCRSLPTKNLWGFFCTRHASSWSFAHTPFLL